MSMAWTEVAENRFLTGKSKYVEKKQNLGHRPRVYINLSEKALEEYSAREQSNMKLSLQEMRVG